MENKITRFLFNQTGIPNLKTFLDLASFRHKLIGGNIANVSTPGYKSRDIKFHDEFKKLTNKGSHLAGNITHPNHIPTGSHQAKPPKVNAVKIEKDAINSIDIDREIPHMVKNELLFSIGATMLKRKFEGIRKAIQSR